MRGEGRINIKIVKIISRALLVTGVAGLIVNFWPAGEDIWKYIAPLWMPFSAFIYIYFHLQPEIPSTSRFVGLFFAGSLLLYSLIFYITLILQISWTFSAVMLVFLICASAGLKGMGSEERDRNRKYDYYVRKFVSEEEDQRYREESLPGVEDFANEQQEETEEEKIRKKKHQYNVYYAVDNILDNEFSLSKTMEILRIPLVFIGLFSALYLTWSYIGEGYSGYIYPLVLFMTGYYLKRKRDEFLQR